MQSLLLAASGVTLAIANKKDWRNLFNEPLQDCGAEPGHGKNRGQGPGDKCEAKEYTICIQALPENFSRSIGNGPWSEGHEGRSWCISPEAYYEYYLKFGDENLTLQCNAIPAELINPAFHNRTWNRGKKFLRRYKRDPRKAFKRLCTVCNWEIETQTQFDHLQENCESMMGTKLEWPSREMAEEIEKEEQRRLRLEAAAAAAEAQAKAEETARDADLAAEAKTAKEDEAKAAKDIDAAEAAAIDELEEVEENEEDGEDSQDIVSKKRKAAFDTKQSIQRPSKASRIKSRESSASEARAPKKIRFNQKAGAAERKEKFKKEKFKKQLEHKPKKSQTKSQKKPRRMAALDIQAALSVTTLSLLAVLIGLLVGSVVAHAVAPVFLLDRSTSLRDEKLLKGYD